MADETAGADEPGISFAAFVLSLAHTAAVHFGDIPDPVTGARSEPSLPAAGQMIDPSVSVPTPTAARFAAMAAPVPELDPHALRSRT